MSAEESDVGRYENGNRDDSTLSRTRTRVSRACTRCRSRKDKCDGARPNCATCATAGHPCSYEPSVKKRGLPEGYVRGLEKLWAILTAKVEGLEDVVSQILADHRHSLLMAWNHRQTGEELHAIWKDSRVLQELEALLAALDSTPSQGIKRKREKDEDDAVTQDSTSALHEILTQTFNVCQSSEFPGHTLSHPLPRQTTRIPPTQDKVILPPVASEIIAQYFKFTHCWLPILNRPHILRRCYEFSREYVEVDQSNADLAVLAAALAYASHYSRGASSPGPPDLRLGGLSFAQLSRKCIPSSDGVFKLGHVQALLLLVLRDMGKGDWNPAWRSVGLAVRALQEILDETPEPSKDHLATQQLCLILDTVVALRLARQPQLCALDVTSRGFLSEDGHEEWEPWAAADNVSFHSSEPAFIMSCFNRMTKIFVTLNDFAREQARVPGPEKSWGALRALESLGEDYPSSLGNSAPRPPHQLWLKVLHSLALAFVAASQSQGAAEVMQHLDALGDALQASKNSSSMGLAAIPTLLLGLLHAVCVALSRHPSQQFDSQSLSTTAVSLGLIANSLTETSKAWPEAGRLVTRWPDYFGGSQRSLSSAPAKRCKGPSYTVDASQTQQDTLNFWAPDPSNQSFNGMAQTTNQALGFANSQTHNSSGHQVFDPLQVPLEVEHPSSMDGVRKVSLDGTTGAFASGHRDPAIATSPSFQGDEIDALFREMAQLDTTEWAVERSQGLKDFGFHDDLTFEAFCNDPDRLYSGTAFNDQRPGPTTQSHELAFDPSLIDQPTTTLDSFNVMDMRWNG